MPEYPDVTLYVEALERMARGRVLERIQIASPFLLRSVEPPLAAAAGRRLIGARRLGKRVVLELEAELFCVLHLMIAGRLRWRARGARIPRRGGLAAFEFEHGTLLLSEASPRKRASLHLVQGSRELGAHDPGGADPFAIDAREFARILRRENHTLKRSLTDPHLLSGIGNAYSDEILHAARLSPLALTQHLDDAELERLFRATRETLARWTARLRAEVGEGFPEKVTAFRPGMAVHGRYRQPCPECGSPVQRIVYAQNEVHYCARCQNEGRLLADRALSRLLRRDWPRSLEELQELRSRRDATGEVSRAYEPPGGTPPRRPGRPPR
ncbi:MAG: DNA-formamidopyrimidine glycosylase family protein [Myxococcota bacterium]